MAIDVQRIINGKIGVGLALLLGRVLPPQLGYPAADFIADRIASRRNSRIVRAVRANQWIARGGTLAGKDLDRAVRETFRNSARSIFDLYRDIQHPQEAWKSFDPDPGARELFARPEFTDRGLIVVSLHLGNFDLILHSMSLQGVKPLVLTIPDPQGGRRMEYDSRRQSGVKILPVSVGALRHALRHLQRGGFVATGIDRPISRPRLRPRFFGRPAALPVHYVFLARKAHVPVMVVATIRQPDGRRRVFSSPPMEMATHPDPETETLRNAEQVLAAAEGFIRRAPGQWSVSLPVWPEVMDRVPR
jgi:lauroyl/myristoyl acyltransferase